MAEDVILYPVRKQLRKVFGGMTKLYPFMELNTMDIVTLIDEDFVSRTATQVANDWGVKASGGSITGPILNTVNGICRITSGGTGGNYCYIFPNGDEGMMGACVLGQLSPVMWVRLKSNIITDVKIECGFTDSDGDDAGVVTTLSAPTYAASDCALWCFDTADGGTGTYWQGAIKADGSEGTKYEPEVSTVTPVGGQYEWLGVAIQENDASNGLAAVKFMHMNQYGVPDIESAWLTTGIQSDVPIIPWIGIHTRTGTERLLDIDYIKVWQRRTVRDD